MTGCPTQRKWFHVNFNIKDKSNGNTLFSVTSIDDNDLNVINNSNIISVRTDECSNLTLPPRAWLTSEAPGFFYFRPSVAQLDGSEPGFENVFVDVESYENIIDESNRRDFEYEVVVAYDSNDIVDGDPSCTTVTGPPDTQCDEGPYETVLDDVRGLILRWAPVPFLTEIGCCNIELSDPSNNNDDDPPTDIQDCARIWVIALNGTDYSLQYYDFDAISSEAHISRGKIVDTGGASIENEWHDLAWDDRNILWGLEKNGIKRILPGNEDIIPFPGINGQAIALDYASITDINGTLTSLFSSGLTSSDFDGKPAMSYSQEQKKLYIYAGDMFFELSQLSLSSWEVVKSSSTLGLGSDVGDLAFDVSGNCYCSANDNLSTINFLDSTGQGFGTINPVGTSSALSGIVGMDFILDLDSGNLLTFYGVHNNGILYEINKTNGSKSAVPGVSFQGTVVGMSSCQAGEDLNSYEVPIATGEGPWLFVISLTDDMSFIPPGSTDIRLNYMKSELSTHITNNMSNGDQISFMTITSGNPDFGGWSDITTVTNVNDALSFIDSMSASGFDSTSINFCGGLSPIFDIPDHNGEKLKSCTILAASDVQCIAFEPPIPTIAGYAQAVMDRAAIELDPSFVINTIGIIPISNIDRLESISTIGGGTHTVWNGE